MEAFAPPDLGPISARVKVLSHDLVRARENLATGKIHPEHYTQLSKILEKRLRELEVEAHTRMLAEVKHGNVAWRPPRLGGGS